MNGSRTKLTMGLILLAVVLLFTVQNTQIVEVRLLFWKLSMSRVLLILLLLVVGALLGWAAHGVYRHRIRR